MPLDFRNTNTLWSSILVETLHRLGLTTAILCPGSRSTPLTVAFAQHSEIEAIPILDERSAAFFALGVAKRLGLPVVLVCTSGTAAANFFPAVIEARYSRVPLLILTADRPPELRDCHAGQAIAQLKLYGDYPNWQGELALPEAEMGMFCYLRQTLVQAWTRSRFPTSGVVHLNIPFRDPLAPIPQPEIASVQTQLNPQDFFAHISQSPFPTFNHHEPFPSSTVRLWQQCNRGIIIAGLAQPPHPEIYCRAIAHLSQSLGFPVLAEGLSPLRNYRAIAPNLISTYDSILRNPTLAKKLAPDIVIQIGELPISKQLRTWLSKTKTHRWVIDPTPENFDPLHGKTTHLQLSVEQVPPLLKGWLGEEQARYLKQWLEAESQIREYFDRTLAATNIFFEGKVAWLLSQHLPPKTPLFIANSMPVRDVEYFWKPNNQHIQPFFNRGANGIDGTLSTAFGISHRNQSSVLLTGDLALLHDTNGLLQREKLMGSLTIILINNQGGGIFEMLPISQFNPPFEEFFTTPQNIDFSKLCLTYNVEYKLIKSWQNFQQLINSLPKQGIRLLELKTDRKSDVKWRKETFARIARNKY